MQRTINGKTFHLYTKKPISVFIECIEDKQIYNVIRALIKYGEFDPRHIAVITGINIRKANTILYKMKKAKLLNERVLDKKKFGGRRKLFSINTEIIDKYHKILEDE